jgi:hypothetical protein
MDLKLAQRMKPASVTNPLTGRQIVVGGAVYKKLLSSGILGTPAGGRIVATGRGGGDAEAHELKERLDPELAGANRHLAVRGGKVLSVRRRPTNDALVDHALDAGIVSALEQMNLHPDEMEDALEQCREAARMKMLSRAPKPISPPKRRTAVPPAPLPRAQAHRNFVVATPAPSEYGDGDGDDAYEPEDDAYEPGAYEPGAYPGAYEDEPAYEDDY